MHATAAGSPRAGSATQPETGPGRNRWLGALWTVVAVASAAGVVLRFVTLSPMWLDEALSVNIASLALDDAVQALRHDGHPLLYYAVLGLWLDLVGDADAAARSLSGLFALAAVAPIWAATRLRLGARAARYAAALALTSPFLIRYGTEARMYALVVLLAATGWLFTELALQRRSVLRLAALALVAAAGMHTHYWMIWLAAAAGAVLAAQWLRRPASRPALTPVLAAHGCGWLALALWAPVLAAQAAHTGTPWAQWARPAEVVVESIQGMGGGTRFEPVLLGMALAGAAALGATLVRSGADRVELGWPGHHRGAPLVAAVLVTLGVGGLAAMASGTAFESRYVAVVVPMLLALAGRGLAGLPRWLGPAALAALALLGIAVGIDGARRDRSQGQEVAAAVNAGAGRGDVLVACPDQLAPAVLRYLDAPVTVLTYPHTDDPRFVDWYDYRDRLSQASARSIAAGAVAAASPGADVWFVTASGYRGFETSCDELAAALRSGRRVEQAVAARPVYEHMVLVRYKPDGP